MQGILFSPTEAAALLELSERHVRKETEHGLLPRKGQELPRIDFYSLVYLQTLRLMGLKLGVNDRVRILASVRRGLAQTSVPDFIEISSVLRLALGAVVRALRGKVEDFHAWKQDLIIDEDILGGEPVFPGSRLAVRRVGGLVERGENLEAILDDYSYLSERDVQFAALFARAYPRVGRPREPRKALSIHLSGSKHFATVPPSDS